MAWFVITIQKANVFNKVLTFQLSVDVECIAATYNGVFRYQCVGNFNSVHVVYYQYAIFFKCSGKRFSSQQMVSVVCEITKAGKEIESVIEIVDKRRHAHIVYKKVQVVCFKLLRYFYAMQRKVKTTYLKTVSGQLTRVSAIATGYIQHSAAGWWLQMGQ
eukprot:Opistho-1_new@96627